jgi:hypothetical protein
MLTQVWIREYGMNVIPERNVRRYQRSIGEGQKLNINTMCDSNGAGTAYPSGAPEFLMRFVLLNIYLYVVYCYSLFVLFRSAIVLFCPSPILLWYLRTFLSGITFIPYSLIQTCVSMKTKGDKLNKQYRLLTNTNRIKNSGAPEGYAVPAPLLSHIVLIFNEHNVIWHGNRFGHQWNKINTK